MITEAIGHYKVIQKIGQGGMGEVYLAEDTSLQRKVALKFLPESLAASEEFRERFLVEARAAAALTHPNICVIHEVGSSGDRLFIAMEFVEGETLQERIRRGGLTFEEVTSILRQVAQGLAEAHGRGIVHRDIKSSNIMVSARGAAKIMDFGLAKVHGGPALTRTRTTLGTAAYMSPEQAAGDPVDHRTDLWSLGVVLYEMLTGDLPFPGERETAVIYHILHEPPKPIGDRIPPVPSGLRRILARALEKDPATRYGSAEELLSDLRIHEERVRAQEGGVLNLPSLLGKLRSPAVGIPAALSILLLSLGAWTVARHRAAVRWAREEALPEIARQIGENDVWRNLVPAYRLAERAEAVLGPDPELAALFAKLSRRIDVLSDPPGAEVYVKEYSHPEAEWSLLGVTPLENVRVPIGILRWRLEKEGYEPVRAAAATWDIGEVEDLVVGADFFRKLDRKDSLPSGMVRVPATETPIGNLGDFFIGRYEVTNREFKAFVDAGGYSTPQYWQHPFVKDGRTLAWDEAMAELVDQTGRPGPSTWVGGDYPPGQDDDPVGGVSWYEAAAYAEYRGMSLPTVTHWEVARGGLTPMIRWPQLGGFGVFAPFTNFGGQGPMPVGSLPGITAYGAYDMAGNVREWTWNEAPLGRVIRGGSWEDNSYEFGNERVLPPLNRSPRNGFRLAAYPEPDEVPEAAFAPTAPPITVDFLAQPEVSEAVYRVYLEQFAYDPTPLNAEVESRVEDPEGGWIQEKVTFDPAYEGDRIIAHLFLPTNAAPPYQTVIYFPGDASSWMPSSEQLEKYYEFTMFLSFLVRNGRAVLFPVYRGTFERGSPELIGLRFDPERALSHAYSDLVVQDVKDFRRSVDYLESRADIDASRLAYYGMSWGGAMGAIIPAVETRLRASVLVAGGLQGVGRPEVSDLTYVSRVKVPTLILNGRYDAFFPPESSARPMLELLGTPDQDKRLLLYETDHIPPRQEYIRETLAWLDEYLGPVTHRPGA